MGKPISDELKDATIQDAILEKFRGNKSFSFEEIKTKEFQTSIHESEFEVENNINALFSEGYLIKWSTENAKIHLSNKGIHTISNPSLYGKVAAFNRAKSKKNWDLFWRITPISVVIILGILNFHQSCKRNGQQEELSEAREKIGIILQRLDSATREQKKAHLLQTKKDSL